MFVVIQEIQLKKPNQYGAYREYKVCSFSASKADGELHTWYRYNPKIESGHFERPNKTAYKISIHRSYRENGKVKKKQASIGTMSYYDLLEFSIYDCIDHGIAKAAELFGEDYKTLYNMIDAKLQPIMEKAEKEWKSTEEYKEVTRRRKIVEKYQKAKAAFAKKYHTDLDTYDECFNVFGDVMNQGYFDEVMKAAKAYEENTRNYYKNSYSGSNTGNNRSYSSYFATERSTYTKEEQPILKKFYKVLSMKFHPDVNPDNDTTKEMQLLNKLKESWGL